MAKKKKKDFDDDDDIDVKKKKKKKRRDDDVDDDYDDTPQEDPENPWPRNDLYVGMATLALLALIVACVFFAVDDDETSQRPAFNVPSLTVPTMGVIDKNSVK